jgi:hypothetical protein
VRRDTSPTVFKQRMRVVSLYSVFTKSRNANNDKLGRWCVVGDVTPFLIHYL